MDNDLHITAFQQYFAVMMSSSASIHTAISLKEKVLSGEVDFEVLAMEVFRYQSVFNPVYKTFLQNLDIDPLSIKSRDEIPFLPVSFFKTHEVITPGITVEKIFTSSGTTGSETSSHLVSSLAFYKAVLMKAFQYFYGDIKNYILLALLPSYLERKGSSLVYMADELINEGGDANSGFFLHDYEALHKLLRELEMQNKKVLLLGVTYALLDLAEKYPLPLHNVIIMETGGMKGRRPELIRENLHGILKDAFGVTSIHSEYGMTELLSQAYSKGDGLFRCPPWMDVVIKDIHDPLGENLVSKTGAIHIIDLANVDSCAFISTHDLGRKHPDGSFEILGRFDNSDIRGCNLMVD